MVEKIHQVKTVDSEGELTDTTRIRERDNVNNDAANNQAERVNSTTTAARVVWFIAGVIIVLLALRFVLILLGANQANAFANFIYTVSYPFAVPFFGIFGYNLKYGVSRVELSTLVAIAVYALIAYGIVKLITIRQPRTQVN